MIDDVNLEFLAKELWRLVKFPNYILASLLHGKYYIIILPLRPFAIGSPHYVMSLSVARPFLTLGTQQKIHSGCEIGP